MSIINPTTEEIESIEEVKKIVPLKEDWYTRSTLYSFCDWKYILLGIDPMQFINRYGYIDLELHTIHSISDDIQNRIKKFDKEFCGYSRCTSEFQKSFIEQTKNCREIAIKKKELLEKIEPILNETLNLMLQASPVEGYNALPTIGAYVLNGNDLQLMYHTQQCRIIPYDNNVDLFATSLGYVAEWLILIMKVYPDLPLRLSDKAMKHENFLRIHSLNSLKLENLLELFIPLSQGKNKEVVLELFLQVLRDAVYFCDINEKCVTLYIARDLFAVFTGIKIEKNGIVHNPRGNVLKQWSFKAVDDLLKPYFSSGTEKTKDQRDERDRIIETLRNYVTSSKESDIAPKLLFN